MKSTVNIKTPVNVDSANKAVSVRKVADVQGKGNGVEKKVEEPKGKRTDDSFWQKFKDLIGQKQ